jgi:hypothetical protein
MKTIPIATKSPTQPQIRNSPTATKARPSQNANRTATVRRMARAAREVAVARYDVTYKLHASKVDMVPGMIGTFWQLSNGIF